MINRLKSYLITDPKLYSDDPTTFTNTLTKALIQYRPDYACFRDKRGVLLNAELVTNFVKICKQYDVRAFINSDTNTAVRLGFDGVHLPSYMLDKIGMVKSEGLQIIASCHNKSEIDICCKYEADIITLSPLFFSPDKGEPFGLEKFDALVGNSGLKTFALGGIVDEAEVRKLENSKAYGFASIRYFVKE